MKAWALPVSALLHAAAILALLPWLVERADNPVEALPIEVELVQQPDTNQGGVPGSEAASTPPSDAKPEPADTDAAPLPAGTPQPPAPPSPAPTVNLGDAAETRDGADVTGQNVIPPSPSSSFRNQPPSYPAEAARQHVQGTVSLVVHVSAQGLPQEVVVASSSGAASLDRAARNAVRRWRFTPAQIQGNPVPFDYSIDIRFILGDNP